VIRVGDKTAFANLSVHMDSHAIYKYQQSSLRPARRASFSAPLPRRDTSIDPSLAHIHEPGGFRRQFIINSARERGQEAPRVLRSFVDFLYLYGHFVSLHVYKAKFEI
jgi:proton-coupled amino acid transporter